METQALSGGGGGMDAISDREYKMRKHLKIRNNMFLGKAGDLITHLFNKYF